MEAVPQEAQPLSSAVYRGRQSQRAPHLAGAGQSPAPRGPWGVTFNHRYLPAGKQGRVLLSADPSGLGPVPLGSPELTEQTSRACM